MKSMDLAPDKLFVPNWLALLVVLLTTFLCMPGAGFRFALEIEFLGAFSSYTDSLRTLRSGHGSVTLAIFSLLIWHFVLGAWFSSSNQKSIFKLFLIIAPLWMGRLLDEYVYVRTWPWQAGSHGTYWLMVGVLVVGFQLLIQARSPCKPTGGRAQS
jgi:hypothetical protein